MFDTGGIEQIPSSLKCHVVFKKVFC